MWNYDFFNIPDSCRVESRIPKKDFYENADLGSSDKKLFTDIISRITLMYYMNSGTINIKPFKDEAREYLELYLLEVQVSEDTKLKKIAEVIMRAIPYPMILIFKLDEKIQLYVSHQRINQSDSSKSNILEDLISTDWLNGDSPLLEKLNIDRMRKTDYYALYSDIIDSISLYNLKSTVNSSGQMTGEEARRISVELEEIDEKISSLKSKIKKETQFNRKMEMNIELNKLKKNKNEIIGGLQE